MKIVYKQTVYEKLVKEITLNGSKIDYIELTEDEYHEWYAELRLRVYGYEDTGYFPKHTTFLGKKIVVK